MKSYIANKNGELCSFQIKDMEPVTETYSSTIPFLVKLEGDESEIVTVTLTSGKTVSTTMQPGWNPEWCTSVTKGTNNIFIGR